MEESKWICTITLSDGTVIENTKKDGFEFSYEGLLDREVFENNCSPIKLESTIVLNHNTQHITEKFTNLELDYFEQFHDKCIFTLKQLSDTELKMKKLQADIDFLLMMSGLEEE